jgi:hypothetical protein
MSPLFRLDRPRSWSSGNKRGKKKVNLCKEGGTSDSGPPFFPSPLSVPFERANLTLFAKMGQYDYFLGKLSFSLIYVLSIGKDSESIFLWLAGPMVLSIFSERGPSAAVNYWFTFTHTLRSVNIYVSGLIGFQYATYKSISEWHTVGRHFRGKPP